MNLIALKISLLYLLLSESCSRADMVVKRKDGHHVQDDTQPTATSAAHSSSQTGNPATISTPITTALPTHRIPLYVPSIGPFDDADIIDVDYKGPGNGGSTIYQVVMSAQATAAPAVTATLIEDATNAELLGGQRVMTIDGKKEEVYAAASCGFADGLQSGHQSKSAGYCVYWYVQDHVTSTWASAVTQISAQTSILPSSTPREPAPTQIIDDTQQLPNSVNQILPSAGLTAAAAAFIAFTYHLIHP